MRRIRIPAWITAWRDWIDPVPLAALCLVGLFGWQTIFGDQGVLTLRRLHHTERSLLNTEQELTHRIHKLEEERRRLHDPAYLELLLRRELGYVRPGETVYQFTDEADGGERR